MVKHNNQLPNAHFHKQWQRRVKTWFDQPAKKKSRRLARAAKAAAVAPRPAAGLLRPAVRCQTVRYNSKVRSGRGFTLDELKAAGINRKAALGLGIAVDFRRTSSSLSTFEANVERLKNYQTRLVVFPRNSSKKAKAGDATKAERDSATQLKGDIMPVVQAAAKAELASLEEARGKTLAYRVLRIERANKRMIGIRAKRAQDEAEAAAAKKK